MVHMVNQIREHPIKNIDDVISLVAFLTNLTVDQVEAYHPKIVELTEVCHVFEFANSYTTEINKLLDKTITNLIERWRHSDKKKILLEAFSKHGTVWHCDCDACNADTDGICLL